jgi:hypothetical protein
MRNKSAVATLRILVVVGALVLLSGGLQLEAQTTMVVSVPTPQIQRKERIVGFEISVRSGRIAELPNVPIGWSISVDNDPSWNTAVKGSIAVGAAALSADFLRHFVVVETEKDAPSDMPFALEGEVVVTADFSTQRTIRLSKKDFQTELRKPPADETACTGRVTGYSKQSCVVPQESRFRKLRATRVEVTQIPASPELHGWTYEGR